jgi:hypothetical protein
MLYRVTLAVLTVVMMLAPAAGAQCPRSWTAAPNGVYDAPTGRSEVFAMTEWDPDGAGPLAPALVVGGNFIAAGSQGADYVAYWNGRWNRLGWGFNAPVHALAVLNGVLYAGGEFTSTGGVAAQYFAYWTGSAWQAAGLGTDGPVYALAVNGSELVVGGNFAHVGGGLIPASYIARFSPGNWNIYPAPVPLPGRVHSIAVLNGQPVVACTADLENDQVMYAWTGSQWQIVDDLTDSDAMGVSGGSLFYSKLLVNYGVGQCAQYNEYAIKSFDGTTASVSYLYHGASSFASYNGRLYAMGFSYHICPYNGGGGPDQPWFGYWDGSQWVDSPLGPGLYEGLLGAVQNILYVGGAFDHVYSGAQPSQAANIAQLEFLPSQWAALEDGLDNTVTCTGNASMFIGGQFLHEGNIPLAYGATWSGQVWESLGAFNGPLTSMVFYRPFNVTINPSLVVSGLFTQQGAIPLNHIGIRDPSNNWSALGAGLNGPALAMISVPAGGGRNDLIAGGAFSTAGGIAANNIARWSSAASAWSALGAGTNGAVDALVYFGGQIIAGGNFSSAGGVGAANIAAWNGTTWAPLGAGLNGAVHALIVYNGQLIAGGEFTNADGSAALAVWNGSAWASFNDGVEGPVYAMVVSGTDLIVGGFFIMAGAATPANNIADWDGTNWNPIGSSLAFAGGGTNGAVYTLSLAGTTLVAGGNFDRAGPESSHFVAMAVIPGPLSITQQPADAAACQGSQTSLTFGIAGWFTGVGYSWRRNNIPISDGITPSGSVYAGTQTATLHIGNIQYGDAGGYSCVATTACGQIATSTTAQLTVGLGCCGSADFNHDGDTATDLDIEDFFACIAGNCCATCGSADFNGDGDTATDADIEAFFRVLAGGTC